MLNWYHSTVFSIQFELKLSAISVQIGVGRDRTIFVAISLLNGLSLKGDVNDDIKVNKLNMLFRISILVENNSCLK